mgnify:CR=1 FL=1|tara:strand:- start:9708 stop:9929 length:222 start_codon:yes stop_codon:yes gene_type:complete
MDLGCSFVDSYLRRNDKPKDYFLIAILSLIMIVLFLGNFCYMDLRSTVISAQSGMTALNKNNNYQKKKEKHSR